MAQQQASEPTQQELSPGALLAGKYRLESRIAQGGMGSVWRAINTAIDAPVAVKVLHEHLVGNNLAEERLLREAKSAARIGHRCIVQVYDVGQTSRGEPFIVMELLRGHDLFRHLGRQGRMNACEAVRLLVSVAEALQAAHAEGIVHRDVKPENILLVTNEHGEVIPKIVDFGVAKLHADHAPRLTADGRVVGSPEYLSPEQASGVDEVDGRADVWGLCVTLYECITGKLPFTGGTYPELLAHIVQQQPKPTTALGGGDDALWQIIAKGLAKRPQDRWASMWQLEQALRGWLEQQTEQPGRTRTTSREAVQSSGHASLRPAVTGAVREPQPRPRRAFKAAVVLAAVGMVSAAFLSDAPRMPIATSASPSVSQAVYTLVAPEEPSVADAAALACTMPAAIEVWKAPPNGQPAAGLQPSASVIPRRPVPRGPYRLPRPAPLPMEPNF